MGPITDKVATAERLPQETKVAIIGGGVIGVSTALFLAERGIPVALFERVKSQGSNPVATGAGAVGPGATAAKCR